ncbi:TRAP transporter small permease [Fodinicurvata sp. EGI_FJ10296]|uniref:TRAP transporter small permease n=1 Tax=Fodinicurvata sp. EGI_FJ10296 TaxID=3231908 RepID=UPI003452D5F4
MLTGILRWFRRLDDGIAFVETVVLTVLCASLGILLFTNVLLRYVFRSPFAWIEEVVVAAFVWMIFLGVSACFRTHQHLRIDLAARLLPKWATLVLGLVGTILMLCILMTLIVYGYFYALQVSGNATPILGISAAWLFYGMPLGMALAGIHIIRQALDEGLDEVLRSVLEREG